MLLVTLYHTGDSWMELSYVWKHLQYFKLYSHQLIAIITWQQYFYHMYVILVIIINDSELDRIFLSNENQKELLSGLRRRIPVISFS